MTNIITYEGVYDLLRKEKIYPELQKIPDAFLTEVVSYLNEKTEILDSQRQQNSIFAEKEVGKTAKQLENIKKMLKEIYERRENKIVKLALIASKTGSLNDSSMLKEEQEMYNTLVSNLNFYRENVLAKVLDKKQPSLEVKPPEKKEGENLKTVRFTNPVPQFIGNDQKVYGPFEEEYVANLPSEIAELLIINKRAQEI
ncbi:DNA replication complex GINS family protein [Candidatus Woesearchaeota archaeon]|nr:DNA replication complex GINS family protein [Candidatus Woesearchaeota archaeon]